ncbi:MAG: sulfatase-like hydrolase/transferase [Propionibacteriaceae bacterium]|nr:sulfatase-like hydrolase/transferase [Propionibacteriaceae bacterium]
MNTGPRPNILVIMTDQQSSHMLGCAGTPHVRTPHLDALAEEGTRFERAYVTFPLCVPSRSSMMTGMTPHELGVLSNAPAREPDEIQAPESLAHLMRDAGYRCGHAGKWHATRASAETADGFEWLRDFGDAPLVSGITDFLGDQAHDDRPFFLVASFDDPHTICEVARNQPSFYGELPTPDLASAPNLPPNFGSQPFEPEALRVEQAAGAAMYGTAAYTPEDWRLYRQAYAHLVERADARVGEVLATLQRTGFAADTLVIFTSDHGDGDAAHAWNQKTALFEETIRVPLIMRWPGTVAQGVTQPQLVSVGLDLLPTICEAAGIEVPHHISGRSLLSFDESDSARDHVVVETGFGPGARPTTSGRAVVGERYKYVVYSWGRHREQLFDLLKDPGEIVNLAVEARHHDLLEQNRRTLLRWCRETDDQMMLKRLVLPADTTDAVRGDIYAVPY